MKAERPRHLRRNATEAEKGLWRLLRDRALGGAKFRRQFPIGDYIADFVCLEHRLIVEADGGQHNASGSDMNRTAWLESQGFHVMRFWNNDILDNPDGVAAMLLEALGKSSAPSLAPSPGR